VVSVEAEALDEPRTPVPGREAARATTSKTKATRRPAARDEAVNPNASRVVGNTGNSKSQPLVNLPWQFHDPVKGGETPPTEIPLENVPLDDPLLTTLPVTLIPEASESFFPP
jgi:hypothetical protein